MQARRELESRSRYPPQKFLLSCDLHLSTVVPAKTQKGVLTEERPGPHGQSWPKNKNAPASGASCKSRTDVGSRPGIYILLLRRCQQGTESMSCTNSL